MATGRPLVIDDAQAHPVLDPVRQRFAVQKISAIAVVPMACEGTVAGVLFVRSRSRGGFSPREVGFLCTVASAAAVALRNAADQAVPSVRIRRHGKRDRRTSA